MARHPPNGCRPRFGNQLCSIDAPNSAPHPTYVSYLADHGTRQDSQTVRKSMHHIRCATTAREILKCIHHISLGLLLRVSKKCSCTNEWRMTAPTTNKNRCEVLVRTR